MIASSSFSVDMFQIRRAKPDDASAIYDLIVQGFGAKYLYYTVYQAPKSVAYLRQLIENRSNAIQRALFVLEWDKRLVGYYEAMQRDAEFWLNYVAVATDVRQRGIGQALLEHFDHTARQARCKWLILDVFDSNDRAREWYYRQGYRFQSSTFQVRLSTATFADVSACPLTYSDEIWQRACNEEKSRGFSKIDCQCGTGWITVGLIGDRVCKLLDFSGVDLENVVRAIGRHFYDTRPELIVATLDAIPPHWSVLSVEKTLRLIKPLTANRQILGQ